jgi:murein DD-endopeptidase MepM/ murein hydrolase activator NlpD
MRYLEMDRERTVTAARVRRVFVTLVTLGALITTAAAQASYEVQPGDTLGGIAERHGTSVSVLMRENDISAPNRLLAGSTITIPAEGGGDHHVVGFGENLTSIAQRYGVSTAQLVEWNGLRDANSVWAGVRLAVSGPAAVNVSSSEGGTHRVAAGENLTSISRRYGVSVMTLASANRIADPDRIRAGSTLTIPGGGWHCPVAEGRFINDYGVAKPGGRFHDGIDVYAPKGTPVVAPVAGRVEQIRGDLGGLQFHLFGVDGHTYIGTHLDSFGAAGKVRAGEVLGTVGTSGNARGTSPHLHLEIHLDGSQVTNPYPSLRSACG